MTKNTSKILQAMHDSFLEDSLELKMKQQNNHSRLKELKALIESYKEETTMELDIFYPKKTSSYGKNLSPNSDMYKKGNEIIGLYEKEKENIEFDNHRLNSEIIKMEHRISDLQEIISVNSLIDSLIYLDIQEKERKRIARDLHDSSMQNLTHLIHSLEFSSLLIDKDPTKAKLELELAGKKIRVVIDDIRNTIYDLRPMEFNDLNFKDVMLNMVDRLQKDTDILIHLNMQDNIVIHNELVFTNIYRMIKECITNSIKHSEASEIKVAILEEGEICNIVIKDNGKGFNGLSSKSKKNHFGLKILEERVQLLKGNLNIHSEGTKESGTKITIKIPIIDDEGNVLREDFNEY